MACGCNKGARAGQVRRYELTLPRGKSFPAGTPAGTAERTTVAGLAAREYQTLTEAQAARRVVGAGSVRTVYRSAKATGAAR